MDNNFNHIKVPKQWRPYWDTYPEGYTIMEALIEWVRQVNKMVDNINDWNKYLKEFIEKFEADLQGTVVDYLVEWYEDGTLAKIINEEIFNFKLDTAVFEEFKEGYEEFKEGYEEFKGSFDKFKDNKDKTTLYLADYEKLPEDTSDSERIQRVIDMANDNSVIIFPHHTILEVNSQITIDKPIHIVGNGTELRTIFNGLGTTFSIKGVNDFSIEGLKFNQNLKGRTSIDISDCSNFIIKDCYFTGYSKEYAYYQTDGGIRVDNSQTGKIINNTWEHHGDQYDATTSDLNRCLSIHGGTKDILVDGNLFSNVNQAIVTLGENITISNNLFKGVRDNSLYLIESKNITVTGNNFIDGYDEGIVIVSCENVAITGNNIKEVPNKHFAIDGTCKNINITGNICENIVKGLSNFISVRTDDNATVENFTIIGNIFKNTVNVNNYDRFYFGNVRNIMMIGNTIEIETVNAQRILSFRGHNVVTGNISDNVIKGSTIDTLVIDFPGGPSELKVICDDNEIGGRFRVVEGVQAHGYNLHPGLAYATGKRITRMVYADSMPTYGYWQVGDIVININENSPITGWICTKSGGGTEAVFTEI